LDSDILLHLATNVGLSKLDVVLLLGCPFCAALGTTVSAVIRRVSEKPVFTPLSEIPPNAFGEKLIDMSEGQRLKFLNQERKDIFELNLLRHGRGELVRLAFIGLVLGFVVSLYFVGAITDNITSIARIFALCILLGYQAPQIWALQENIFKEAVEKKLRQMTEVGSSNSPQIIQEKKD
jgi:hypothetical protein